MRLTSRAKRNNKGLYIAGVGAAVSGVGALVRRRSRLGNGMVGFGLAHIALGLLDTLRD